MGNLLKSLRYEKERRSAENIQMQYSIEHEQERISRARQESKKSLLRKIKPIDKLGEKSDAKKDEKELEEFITSEKQRIARDRHERKQTILKENALVIVVGCAIIIAIIIGAIVAVNCYHNARMEASYEAAVSYALEEDFEKAEKCLTDMDVQDSAKLRKYCNVQDNIISYCGKPVSMMDELNSIGTLKNKEIAEQCDYACKQLNKADDVQKQVDGIEVKKITADSEDNIDILTEKIAEVEERYQATLDLEKYEIAISTINHINKKTGVGKTIEAINKIGDVSPDSEKKIENARKMYEDLTISERGEVVNISVLKEAEEKFEALKQEKAKLEKKAEQEKETAEEEAEWENATVYITPSGSCYHIDGCSTTRNSRLTAISRSAAKARGLHPCSKCNPDRR